MPKKLDKIIHSLPNDVKKALYQSIFHENNTTDNHPAYLFLIFLENLTFLTSFYKLRTIGKPIISKTGNPPSMFTMSFMPSGSKKDFGLALVEQNIFNDSYNKIEESINRFISFQKKKLENQAFDKYPNDDINSTIRRADYLEKLETKYLRHPNYKSSNSTMEGLHADRRVFQDFGYGSSFYFVKEISSYYTRHSEIKASLDAYLLESSETGDTTGKSIKSDTEITEVKNVPVSVHMHGTIESQKLPPALQTFLKEGAGRRIFVFFADNIKKNKDLELMSDDELRIFFKKQNDSKDVANYDKIRNIVNRIAEECDHKKMLVSEEVAIEYQVQNIKYRKLNADLPHKAHFSDIPWRALKIASPLQLLFDAKSEELTLSTYNIALEIVAYYAQFYKKMMKNQEQSLEEKAISIIKGKKEITFSRLKKALGEIIKDETVFNRNILETSIDLDIKIDIKQTNRGLSYKYIS